MVNYRYFFLFSKVFVIIRITYGNGVVNAGCFIIAVFLKKSEFSGGNLRII